MKKQDDVPICSGPSLLKDLANELRRGQFGQSQDQCAAICFRRRSDRETEVLLITSRDTGRWIIPKGWPMDGKTHCEAASIEACEEAGVRGKVEKNPFGYYSYLKKLNGGKSILCVVAVFLIEVMAMKKKFREKGQRTLVWLPFNEAAARVEEPELKGLLLKLGSK